MSNQSREQLEEDSSATSSTGSQDPNPEVVPAVWQSARRRTRSCKPSQPAGMGESERQHVERPARQTEQETAAAFCSKGPFRLAMGRGVVVDSSLQVAEVAGRQALVNCETDHHQTHRHYHLHSQWGHHGCSARRWARQALALKAQQAKNMPRWSWSQGVCALDQRPGGHRCTRRAHRAPLTGSSV